MDKDRVEGKMKDVKGRVKRQVGEWTDDAKLQGEGLVDQAEGKIQNTFGKGKDQVRDAADDVRDEADRTAEPSKDSGDRFFDKTKRSA
ncbi:MAG TPA: CsbD family protein [Terriglobales bacterium]|nr:CsbD family protein [Terriglobales bacterium]